VCNNKRHFKSQKQAVDSHVDMAKTIQLFTRQQQGKLFIASNWKVAVSWTEWLVPSACSHPAPPAVTCRRRLGDRWGRAPFHFHFPDRKNLPTFIWQQTVAGIHNTPDSQTKSVCLKKLSSQVSLTSFPLISA